MKIKKMAAKIAGVILAGMMVVSFVSCKEEKKDESANGLSKAQQKLLKEKPSSESNFAFKLSDDGSYVNINSYTGKPVKTLVVPATIQGVPVKNVYLGMSDDEAGNKIKAVVLSEGIEVIDLSFTYSSLTTVVLPSTAKVVQIGANNLSDINLPDGIIWIRGLSRNKLKSVTLPKSLKILESLTFYDCDELEEINIPDGLSVIIPQGKFWINDLNGTVGVTFSVYSYLYNTDEAMAFERDFSSVFSGKKISESVALQKILKEHKSVEVANLPKYNNKPYTEWDW